MAKEVSIKKILEQLKSGISKDEINKSLDLNPAEIKVLWTHPQLVGKKSAKYRVDLFFKDDLVEDTKAGSGEVFSSSKEA